MIKSPESLRQILVCQNRTCRKQGSKAVLIAFQATPVTNVTVIGSSCLGECGSGPMVLVIPDQIWYSSVHSSEVPTVIKRHLQDGHPVVSMLYPKYH